MMEQVLTRQIEAEKESAEKFEKEKRSKIERLELAYMEAMDKCNIPLANSIWKELIDVRKLNKAA